MIILGIDPGQNTGVATFVDGKLVGLQTIDPHQLPEFIRMSGAGRVIFEDSRLQSHLFSGHKSGVRPLSVAQRLKIARDVGRIDAWCSLITAVCADFGIPAHGISPQAKGAKLNFERFSAITGWTVRCNQHERDAAWVAWPYRGMLRELSSIP